MHTAVLYRDAADSIFVLDLPASIEASQGRLTSKIHSSIAILKPYDTPEPKGVRRDHILSQVPIENRNYHETLRDDIENALRLVAGGMTNGVWCLPRHCSRLLDSTLTQTAGPSVSNLDEAPPLILSLEDNIIQSCSDLQHSTVCNPTSKTCRVVCVDDDEIAFSIPARSVFFWGSIRDGLASVSNAAKGFIKADNSEKTSGMFHLMLLDPPWQNRSVRKSKSYSTSEQQGNNIFDQTIPFIQHNLSPHGWVAVWITNKASIRINVTENLRLLGLVLREEWVWCKVTAQGEPVTLLDGIWRKPYEILLLFCKHEIKNSSVRQRFIFAVPDVHSRKPNLKRLFEELLPCEPVVIELFARHLTTGWWSWGDEVLKFQDTRLWQNG